MLLYKSLNYVSWISDVCVCVCVCVWICALYLTWAVTFIPCASGPSTLVAGGWGRRWRWCDRDAALCPYSKHSGTNVILTQKNCMLLGKILCVCVCVCYLVCEVGKLVKVWIFSSRSPSGWYHLKKKQIKPNQTPHKIDTFHQTSKCPPRCIHVG